MKEKTILIIDDSATIRRLVDSELSAAGYRVLMAPTAEQGMQVAIDERPDLILLDHQLPGTTGYEVCKKLCEHPDLQRIPVVCSSTLRKKAYAEYTELPNVIDMLPKPYTPELLRTTVVNALETATMIVSSQSDGTAVPEVINEVAEGDLSGFFRCFSVRELVDFLNNGSRSGTLELSYGKVRLSYHIAKGRIQGITASGIEPDLITSCLPAAISDLAPMIKFTIRGRGSNEIDGLIELLDNKVLDSRLLKQLLRHQAATLASWSRNNKPESFVFRAEVAHPTLFVKLPLDLSLAAVLVDAALTDKSAAGKPADIATCVFQRSVQRGQNLDRAGMAAQHVKLLNSLTAPATIADLARQSGLTAEEVFAVMRGLSAADLVVQTATEASSSAIAVTGDARKAKVWSDFLRVNSDEVAGKVVRDVMALKLLARRNRPTVVVFDIDCEATRKSFDMLLKNPPPEMDDAHWVVVTRDVQRQDFNCYEDIADLHEWSDSLEGLKAIFGQPGANNSFANSR
jgi:CheY-like chemotaxis protein